MRVLVHCNGGRERGVGHVLRSLALAEQALLRGHDVTFVGVLGADLVRRQLDALPVQVVDLEPGADVDAGVARAVLALAPDVVHVDSYDSGSDLEALVDRSGRACLTSGLEDGEYGRRRADVMVDPTPGAELDPLPARDGVLLRGARFVPLRRAVAERRGEWRLREPATRVLVVMGGTDAAGLTPWALGLLAATGRRLAVTAIVDPGAWDACREVASRAPGLSLTLQPPVDDLPRRMTEADLVVSAAGTTVWELCCLAVPMAVAPAVDNQRPGYERVVAAGAAVGLGSADDPDERAVRRLDAALADGRDRQRLSECARGLVDDLGAWRIVAAWEQLVGAPARPGTGRSPALDVRRATTDDAALLHAWRNDPGTRAVSRRPAPVTWDDHVDWLRGALARRDLVLLIASEAGVPVGTVRWDRARPTGDAEWEVSITVSPQRRGQGLGRRLLAAGEAGLGAAVPVAVWCLATVHEANTASRRLFAGAGYLPDAPADADGFARYARLRRDPS